MKKEKQDSAFSQLMNYAGSYKMFTYTALVLSAVSAVLTLFPFVYLWRIIKADYDERLTVVNLLLDTLNKHFKYAAELKADTDSWYKSIKEKIKAGEDEGVIDKEKAEFSKQAEKLDSVEEQTLAKLENAFDFLEGSKQEISKEDIGKLDQEMLIFVTGLTTGKESSSFLLVNPCDRYKSYSAMYLKGGRRNQLLKEME